MKRFKFMTIAALFVLFALQGCKKEDDPLSSPDYVALNSAMIELWSDHMQWTYATVDAFYHDQNGLQAHLDRLLLNQKNIGDAIKPYYGQAAGDTLTALLTVHIQQAVPVLQAAQANDQPALDEALSNWYANAKGIADFLSAANPEHWPQADMEQAMEHHISQTTAYAVDLLNNNFANAVLNYDIAFDHMMETANLLAKGIALQFPDKF